MNSIVLLVFVYLRIAGTCGGSDDTVTTEGNIAGEGAVPPSDPDYY